MTPTSSNQAGNSLLDLAARCEAATGPDRELDALIHIAANFPTWRLQTDCEPFPDAVQPGRIQEDGSFAWRESPAFTASLDAAMTLVPEGARWLLGYAATGNPKASIGYARPVEAATPALALTAAALRARAAQ